MKKFVLTIGVSLGAIATGAMAQDTALDAEETANEGQLDTIVVTAQRRQESVQDVPIAISAFTAAELESRGVTQALDIALYVPNLVGLNNTGLGSANSYYLRGLGNSETIPTFDPPVGTYVDDIYLSRQNANNLQFFDVERVEVLRGPQGTLFGRNTTGGAVSLILAEPGDELGGYVEAGYGSYDRKLVRGSVDIPLADSFAVKVSGYYDNDDGYAISSGISGTRVNDSDGWGMRLGVRGELSDNVRWIGSYAHVVSEGENSLNFDCDPKRPTVCNGRFVSTGYAEGDRLDDGPFVGRVSGPKQFNGNGNYTSTDIISSNFEVDFGAVTLNVITGFVHTVQDYGLDFADGRGLPSVVSPVPATQSYTSGGFTIVNDGTFDQFTQEVKLTGSLADGMIDFVGGAFYFKEDNNSDFADGFTVGPGPTGFTAILADRTLDNTTEAVAGYLQADFNATDALKLTAGIRYTDEKKTFSIRDNRPSAGGNLCAVPIFNFGPGVCLNNSNLTAANGQAIPTEQNVGIWTPRFAINYDVNGDVLLFASATRGFKSGGWNARGTNPAELLPFEPEKVWSYEAGFKSELFDNRLRFNATAYFADVSGLQTPSALIRDNGSIGFITRNFADYENYGVEVELQARPVERLNIFLSGGWQKDEYKLSSGGPAEDEFGVASVGVQQAQCLAQLGNGLIPGVAGPDGAPACGNGIIAPDGSLSEPVRTPEFTLAVGANYEFLLSDTLSLTPSVNASWRDDSEVGTNEVSFYDAPITGNSGTVYASNPFGDGAFITGSESAARWIVNASLTLRIDDRYSLSAECRNCFDKEAVESALANYSYLNAPRSYLIKAGVKF